MVAEALLVEAPCLVGLSPQNGPGQRISRPGPISREIKLSVCVQPQRMLFGGFTVEVLFFFVGFGGMYDAVAVLGWSVQGVQA